MEADFLLLKATDVGFILLNGTHPPGRNYGVHTLR
jgi:hypothetical protein